MAIRKPPAPIINIKRSYEAMARARAAELGLAFQVFDPQGWPDALSFHFEPMEDAQLLALFNGLPLEAFAQCLVGWEPPGAP
jgi:hypothetical protein